MHQLVILAVEERSKGVIPSTLKGQVDKHDQMSQMKEEELKSSIKWPVPNFKAQDPLIKVNLGMEEEPKTIKVNGLLVKEDRNQLIKFIK